MASVGVASGERRLYRAHRPLGDSRAARLRSLFYDGLIFGVIVGVLLAWLGFLGYELVVLVLRHGPSLVAAAA